MLRSRGIRAIIPGRRDLQEHRRRPGSTGGCAPKFDPEDYKGRNVVERSFALLKHWQGVATRFDKLAVVYRAAAVLVAVLVWARNEQTHARALCPAPRHLMAPGT